jgi:hypothetical protein
MVKQSDDFPKARFWHYAWIALAILYAIPVAMHAYDRVIDVTRKAREQLIVQHRLWELHPEYHGTPETWTRFASRRLNDRQLMGFRVTTSRATGLRACLVSNNKCSTRD